MLVAKRKSLFDDKAVEIQELTYIIKQVCIFSDISIDCFNRETVVLVVIILSNAYIFISYLYYCNYYYYFRLIFIYLPILPI